MMKKMMTKEIAIHNLYALKLRSKVFSDRDALDMAIEALEQEPCEDCISREETLKAFAEKCGGECACCEYNGSGYDTAENCKLIKSMPSVKPQRKKGRWIQQEDIHKHHYGWLYCSECGAFLMSSDGANYCSCCGAEMEAEA